MNAAAILSLIGSLYEQVIAARQRIEELEAQLAEKDEPCPPSPS